MSKKKAIAILLFIFIGLFMFSYAEPAQELDKEQVLEKEEVTKPVINDNYHRYPIVENIFPSPIITAIPEEVIILLGQDYDVMTGVEVESKEDLEVVVNIKDTTELEVGKYTITYEVKDSRGNEDSTTRTIIVLAPDGDEDKDGFTNEEEMEETKEPTDSEKPVSPENPLIDVNPTDPMDPESHPETYAPKITVKGENPYIMLVDDKYEEPGYEITVDEHDKETTEEDVVITGKVDSEEVGTYELTYTITDIYGKSASDTREVKVLTREGDEDKDGFTNEEEIEEGTNPEDKEDYPSYQPNPIINIDSCKMEMIVYDEIPSLDNCVTVTDEFYGSEGVSFEVDYSDIDKNTHGIYKVIITAHDNLNNETKEEFEFKVLKRDVTIIVDNKSSIYLEEIKEFTSNEDEVTVEGTDIGVSLSSPVTNTSDVGTYEITGTWTNENYNVTFENGVYTITAKELAEDELKDLFDVEFNDKTVTYDGEEHSVVIEGELPEGISVSYTNNKGTEVGVYSATATFIGTGNYKGKATLEATLEITQKTLTENDLDNLAFRGLTVTYDGETHSLEVVGLPEEFTVTYTNNNQINVGTYEVVATITGNGNYTGTVEKTATLVINKASVTITADNKQSVYGEAIKKLTYKVAGTVYGSDDLNIKLEKEEGIDVGEYAITVSASNSNYDIKTNNAIYTISPKTLETSDLEKVQLEDKTVTYDGNAHNLEVTDLPEGFTVSYSQEDLVNVGTYEITATITGNENYSGQVVLTATLTIIPKEVTVNWTNITFEYDGNKHMPTATAEVDVVVSVKEGTDGISAGTHTAVATLKTANANYKLTNTEINYTITSKDISNLTEEEIKDLFDIEFTDKTVTYNGEEHTLLVSGEGLSNVTVSYNNTNKATNAGTYPVVATITAAGNYKGTATLTATLTINKAKISLKAEDKEIVYGDAAKELTYTITSGFKYGLDDLNVSLTREDASNNNAGTYVINITASNANYDITLINGTYTIKKAKPDYIKPTGLTEYEGATLSEIELPEGFTYEGDTNTPLTVPTEDREKTYTVKVTYTPTDTTNYETVTGIEVDVLIKAKYYTITFVDKDNKPISVQSVRKGGSAQEPSIAEEYEANRKIYVFNGWVGTYTNVTEDATITPLYIEESTSTANVYILDSKYLIPENGGGYLPSDYEDALSGKEVTINISGITKEQAEEMKNIRFGKSVIVAVGEENVMKYLSNSTKAQLESITKGFDEGGSYTIEWYVLKYEYDGWHLDGHKVYDTTTLDISVSTTRLNLIFNNSVTNLSVTIDGEVKSITNSNQSLFGTTKIGNEYYASINFSNNERTVVVKYTVKGIEYTKEYILKGTTITEK